MIWSFKGNDGNLEQRSMLYFGASVSMAIRGKNGFMKEDGFRGRVKRPNEYTLFLVNSSGFMMRQLRF